MFELNVIVPVSQDPIETEDLTLSILGLAPKDSFVSSNNFDSTRTLQFQFHTEEGALEVEAVILSWAKQTKNDEIDTSVYEETSK
jgi:hypothetical protein